MNCGGRGVGGAEEDRTPDLLIANEALSQLSYGPTDGSGQIVALAGDVARPAERNGVNG